MEDWNAIQAEVADAIKSVSDVSQADGYPVALRKVTITGGDDFNAGSGTETISYTTVYAIDGNQRILSVDGTLIQRTQRTITITANSDVTPEKEDKIAVGLTKDEVDAQGDENVAWEAIGEVRPLSPVGVVILWELDLVV